MFGCDKVGPLKDAILRPIKNQTKRILMRTKRDQEAIANAHGILVLCYHSVPTKSKWYYDISRNKFEQHLRYLSEHFSIITPSDLSSTNQYDDRIHLMITFDDGYLDNYLNVFPLLCQYEVPATFFITAGNIEESNQRIIEPTEGVEKKLLNWEQIKEMSDNGFATIGSHSFNHVGMASLSIDEAQFEMHMSKKTIEDRIKTPLDSFSYPGGFFNKETGALLSTTGYKTGFTSVSCVNKSPFNYYEIGRIAVTKQHESLPNLAYLITSVLKAFKE